MNKMFTNPIYIIYMYKEDLALNNLQWLICHKTQPNQISKLVSINTNNLQVNGTEYSYQIQMIFKLMYLTLVESLTGTTNLG